MNVKITRYPMHMTGAKLARKLGHAQNALSNKSFKIKNKFKSIKKHNRLRFLQNQVNKSAIIKLSWQELLYKRNGFNANKIKHLPLSDKTFCYCCDNIATIRHHVIPLSNGGRNKANNIVPLCNDCHCKVHPHMRGSFAAQRLSIINGPPVVRQDSDKVNVTVS